jgi:hypothetical protein
MRASSTVGGRRSLVEREVGDRHALVEIAVAVLEGLRGADLGPDLDEVVLVGGEGEIGPERVGDVLGDLGPVLKDGLPSE